MCYFITLVVPGADEASIALVLYRSVKMLSGGN